LGSKLTISLQCLQLEIKSDKCPLFEPFQHLGTLTTSCWCNSFWESLDHCNYDFHLDYPTIPQLREGDWLLKDIFLATRPTPAALISLNQCRNSWNTLFLSDITSANGKLLHQHCLLQPTALTNSCWSSLSQKNAPQVKIGSSGWSSGNSSPMMAYPSPLGSWIEMSHVKWDWCWDEHLQLVQRKYSDKID